MTLTLILSEEMTLDVESAGFITAFRSDRVRRTVCPDELEMLIRKYDPNWQQCRNMDPSSDLRIFFAEIDLEAPVSCRACGQSVPIDVLNEDLICPRCRSLPAEILGKYFVGR
jgi:hypothetical protein